MNFFETTYSAFHGPSNSMWASRPAAAAAAAAVGKSTRPATTEAAAAAAAAAGAAAAAAGEPFCTLSAIKNPLWGFSDHPPPGVPGPKWLKADRPAANKAGGPLGGPTGGPGALEAPTTYLASYQDRRRSFPVLNYDIREEQQQQEGAAAAAESTLRGGYSSSAAAAKASGILAAATITAAAAAPPAAAALTSPAAATAASGGVYTPEGNPLFDASLSRDRRHDLSSFNLQQQQQQKAAAAAADGVGPPRSFETSYQLIGHPGVGPHTLADVFAAAKTDQRIQICKNKIQKPAGMDSLTEAFWYFPPKLPAYSRVTAAALAARTAPPE
ncbi:hypothetical protein, conserved [Eimeria tenella]|uniref:Uncharacterized protein n=1 Tax=Eimeria tenella TaxID=5802 RepID=U6L109_EIMTE|nr:hypothetical protein, conserved [Eimeria tenella]CDJ41420.1 hypothetical protein, conserved [Eimeria tenella]|eukprot:XP_013232170.1 hypothetical protein, conserved [Eimeria tenella]